MKSVIILLSTIVLTGCSSLSFNGNSDDQAPASQAMPNEIASTTTTPVHRNDLEWWAQRHQGVLDHVKKGNVDLLMIGDSITHAWPDRALQSWNQTVGSWNVVNMGFSGDRTEHLIWRLQNGEVDDISPKVAVLMIGTNNTGHNMDPATETIKGIKAVITELQTRLPMTKIILHAVFPRGVTADDPMRIRNDEINSGLTGLVDYKTIYYLDMKADFIDEDGSLSADIMPDYLHPNEAGYDIWSKALTPLLSVLMANQ
ncbi:MAG: acetylglucosamine-6-sulfatase [Kordiimonadaceae bacterium]|jgi:beta-glucosidase|nr:acetylglucosamine-6-sulfatase [Kordiimonadaceae bacterium]